MAANDKPKLDLPWGTLLPLIAALAGIIVQYRPLVSERPAAPGEKPVETVAEQDVDARLWQDPLAVARKAKEAHEEEEKRNSATLDGNTLRSKARSRPGQRQATNKRANSLTTEDGSASSKATPTHGKRHTIEALANTIRDRATSDSPERVLLLAVMIDAGPYAEQGESRLRSRQAVLEALSEGKFVPVDGEHIGFVTAPWPPEGTVAGGLQGELLIPWERCNAADKSTARVYPRNTGNVFILWLPASNLNPVPFSRFATLIDWLTKELPKSLRDKIDIKLIGPVNSTGLQYMVDEAQDWPRKHSEALFKAFLQSSEAFKRQMEADQAQDVALSGLSIISPRATMSAEALLYRPADSLSKITANLQSLLSPQQSGPLKKTVEEEIENGIPAGLSFARTIATDDVVLDEMIKELKLRNVDLGRDKIVILTEWDSPYGRSLATTFAARASNQSYADLIENPEKNWPDWILSYRYLRGIDGRLPGEQQKSADRQIEEKKQNTLVQPKPEELTEGSDQSDYLRRLARALKNEDIVWQRQRQGVIRAIGLLGSDIYDKLMIVRALRPQFPDVIFFTNNFDAHFERRADWPDLHNLVIVSPFGSKLPSQRNVAPFRDNIQTSMYTGTLVAIGLLDEQTATALSAPRVFEISRRGTYDFDAPYNETHWFLDWLNTGGRKIALCLAAIWFVAVGIWFKLAVVRSTSGGGIRRGSFDILACSTGLCLALCVPTVVLAISLFAQTRGADAEPLAFFSGISIWPTEMLRLIAIVLAVHFMIKSRLSLKANERDIAERFCLGGLQTRTPHSRNLWERLKWNARDFWEGLKPLQMAHSAWLAPDAEFSAEDAWHAYLRRNRFWPRLVRVTLLSSIFGLSVFFGAIFVLFTRTAPAIPARGLIASDFHFRTAYWVGMAVTVLTFYVVDAIQLNGNFIRIFTRGLTKWPSQLSLRCKRIPPLSEEELSRYHDILFVADRTEVVSRLIWYPLIVLALLFVGRSSFFDNWTWYPGLILLFALTAMWAVGSAIFLRHAAEQLRQTAVENLQLARVAYYADEEKRRMLNELIPEIRGLKKGAFAPLRDQPFIRALVLPSGGLGLLAVGLRLFEGF